MRARLRYARGMKRVLIFVAAAAISAPPALAQGAIGTVERGQYLCELPGDATARAGVPQPGAGFTIASASRYKSAEGDGVYLRRGNTLAFTSGPRAGETYQVVSEGFLRLMENGKPGRLRCVRQ